MITDTEPTSSASSATDSPKNITMEEASTLYYNIEDVDKEDAVMQTRILLLKKMIAKGPVSKEKQERILFGHQQRKIKENEEKEKESQNKTTINNYNNNNNNSSSTTTSSYSNNSYISRNENEQDLYGNKKHKKQITDYPNNSYSNYGSGSSGYHNTTPPPATIISPSLKSKFDEKIKQYEKNKQLLGLSELVVEFDRGFYANHTNNKSKSMILVESPDANRNSNFLDMVSDTTSIVAYYQYDNIAKKKKYNKVINAVKREYNNSYYTYTKEAESYFTKLSNISTTGASKYIKYRRETFGGQDLSKIVLSFRDMPVFPMLEDDDNVSTILYRRLFYINQTKEQQQDQNGSDDQPTDMDTQQDNSNGNDDEFLEGNGFGETLNNQQKHFLSFLKKVKKSVVLPSSNDIGEINDAIGMLILKIIGYDDQQQLQAQQKTKEINIDDVDDDSSNNTSAPPPPLIHLIIDDLPSNKVELIKLIDASIKTDKCKLYTTISCRFNVPSQYVNDQVRIIRLPNPNFYQNLNYLEQCIAPLSIPDDGFNAHDYPNIYRILQFNGGQSGLNDLFSESIKQIRMENAKQHIRNITLDDVMVRMLRSLILQQQQDQQYYSVSLLPDDNQDIPLLVLLAIVGFNYKEAKNKLPKIEEYYTKGVISIQNNSVFMSPILMKYYLEYSIDFTGLTGNVFQIALNILKRFSRELYIWTGFYEDYYQMKLKAYQSLSKTYPQFDCGKLTVRKFFYPNQKLGEVEEDSNSSSKKKSADKTDRYFDHADIKEFNFKFAVETNWKKTPIEAIPHAGSQVDNAGNIHGNHTYLVASPQNQEYFNSDTEKLVDESIKGANSIYTNVNKEMILFFTRKYNPIVNTPYFKIINPIESNYYSSFSFFIDSLEL